MNGWAIGATVVFLSVCVYYGISTGFFQKIWTPFARWKSYWVNITTITTAALVSCILLTVFLGFLLYWSPSVPDVVEEIFRQINAGTIFKTIWHEYQDGDLGNALLNGITMVFNLLEGNCAELRSGFPNHPYLTWWLCFLIPTLTVSAVIMSVLKGLPKWLPSKEEYLIFAQPEENSIRLAENMMPKEKYASRLVIFLRTNTNDLYPEQAARLKKIKASVYPYTEADLLRIHWGLRKKKLRFFFLSANTDLNFSRMKIMLEEVETDALFSNFTFRREKRLKEEETGTYQQELYLLSETNSAPLLVDLLREDLCQSPTKKNAKNRKLNRWLIRTLRKCFLALWTKRPPSAENSPKCSRKPVFLHTDLRLLDRYRTVMYDLLEKRPLYNYADDKTIRVLILGFGRVGQAFFRAATSFCPMAEYETEFYIRDNNIDKKLGSTFLWSPAFLKLMPLLLHRTCIISHKSICVHIQNYTNMFPYICTISHFLRLAVKSKPLKR